MTRYTVVFLAARGLIRIETSEVGHREPVVGAHAERDDYCAYTYGWWRDAGGEEWKDQRTFVGYDKAGNQVWIDKP